MEKIKKNDDEWKKELTDDQFHVARKKGTEPAFTGEYWNNHEKGTYRCRCCGNELFSSEPSLIPEPVGRVFGPLSRKKMSPLRRTIACLCGEPRSSAVNATLI